ncbi:COQ9 family protein [Phenylobacterium sp.]|uniref:COQ9 family protein n=1 Tax=Phenylobacterium sp. TaxID=1871053 RepID=UPI0027334C2A|nr:COQ9 family protein [Phenylobacterium sp.]MDP3658833.1 COQ9 family protein [Phenylobacterium sp.]
MSETLEAAPQGAEDWAAGAERRVMDAALTLAPTSGWSQATLLAAGRAAGLSEADVGLLMPRGPADLAALLSRRHDAAALAALGDIDPLALRIRERIARAVEARIDAAFADEAALRRWAGFLALPSHAALGLRLGWESADALWRWAGDVAADENHYSKRAILASILTGALAVRLQSGREAAETFVARRIDNVMAFEKWKATTRFKPGTALDRAARLLGRLRYR